MRLSDLLKMEVVDSGGAPLGQVHDVRFISDSQTPTGWSAASLLVGRTGFAARLGYVHGTVAKPWPLGAVIRIFARHGLEIPWERVVAVDPSRIVVSGTPNEFSHPLREGGDE